MTMTTRENLFVDITPEQYHKFATEGSNPWNQLLVSRLHQVVSELNRPAPVILDIGMGTGHLLMTLAADTSFEHCKLAGLDIDPGMVNKAREEAARLRLSDRLTLLNGDVHAIPYKDNEIDIIYGRSIVHHWANPVKGFTEIFRVLKPGGVVVIHEPLRDPEAAALAAFNAGRKEVGVENMSIEEKYTVSEIKEQLEQAKFAGHVRVERGEGAAALGCEIYLVKAE